MFPLPVRSMRSSAKRAEMLPCPLCCMTPELKSSSAARVTSSFSRFGSCLAEVISPNALPFLPLVHVLESCVREFVAPEAHSRGYLFRFFRTLPLVQNQIGSSNAPTLFALEQCTSTG